MTVGVLTIVLALLLTLLGLNLPNSVDELLSPQYWYLPSEFLVALALVIAVGGKVGRILSRGLGLALALMIVIRVADRLTWLWFGRELVLATDVELILPLIEVSTAGWRYLPLAIIVAVASSMLLLLSWPLIKGLQAASRLPRLVAALPVILAGLWFVNGPISAFGVDQIEKQVGHAADARNAETRFQAALAADPWRNAAPELLFPQLQGVDVLIVFVESYGRSSFDHPDVAPATRSSLERLTHAAARSGKSLVSGFVRSPTLGGQSWLAHATVASGVTTTGQGGWRVYLKEASADIAHLFQRAGHATFMVQPAIVRPFPEADRLGFDELLFAEQLRYEGPRPGYVTMPDQYTLSQVERILDMPSVNGRYGQIALIGSHAPFTPPVPPILPWDKIGGGSAFEGQIADGPSATALWADGPSLLKAYAGAMAGTIDLLASWAELPVGRPRLVLMLGDHEPAARVLGMTPGYDVPLHVLGSSPDLVMPFRKLGFLDGAWPDPNLAPIEMSALRQILLEGFGEHGQQKLAATTTIDLLP